ncbi:hypothetical protein PI125_g12458 [Phytophthora idaei]|nr:hypothetical protein PI125_g12458 [Phytophthora idaei]
MALESVLVAAVDTSHLELVVWIMQQPGVVSDNLCIYVESACSNDYFEVLEWVTQHYSTKCHVEGADSQAASDGRLDIVRLLHENNVEGCSRRVVEDAASYGHFDIVK